ncbi:MAG: MMPL family transporter, partial [Micrococcales bacterium]|nr:MMPL family transporter [Micrococcales bacterium]
MIPALLVLAWLVVGGVGGPFAGKLTQVQSNDAVTFLPSSADATKVAQLQREFSDSQLIPAVVVADRQGGITPQDLEYLNGLSQDAKNVAGVSDQVSPPVTSGDGQAAQIFVGVDATVDPGKSVEALRELIAADAPSGLQVLVTGPAGQTADLSEAFAGIDGLLLLVAGGVVALILVVVYRSPLLPVLVLLSAIFALALASAIIYLLASTDVIALDGQSQGILFILVFGAATDYALLLVSRFREELGHDGDRF